MKKVDLTGRRFGALTVSGEAESSGGKARWVCACRCGGTTVTNSGNLTRGRTLSCGCLQRSKAKQIKTTHGWNRTPEHRAWSAMKSRCYNQNFPGYPGYGGRGITVCDAWRDDFTRFFDDMGQRPSPAHSVDRIDNNRGYEAANCRWADKKSQARNRRSNTMVVYGGTEMTLAEAAEASGISAVLISGRKYRGWPDNDLFQPPYARRAT